MALLPIAHSWSITIDGEALAFAELAKWKGRALEDKIWQASAAGARVLIPALQAAAPRASGWVPHDYPRDLAGSIHHIRIKGIGYAIGPMGKTAFHRYWVTGGTAPHFIKPKRATKTRARKAAIFTPYHPVRRVAHPGARANPFVDRTGRLLRGAVEQAMIRSLLKAAQ